MTIEQFSDNNDAFRLWDSIYRCLYHFECEFGELDFFIELNKFVEF